MFEAPFKKTAAVDCKLCLPLGWAGKDRDTTSGKPLERDTSCSARDAVRLQSSVSWQQRMIRPDILDI